MILHMTLTDELYNLSLHLYFQIIKEPNFYLPHITLLLSLQDPCTIRNTFVLYFQIIKEPNFHLPHITLSQRLLPRILSDTFYSSLKTLLFSRARVGSASE